MDGLEESLFSLELFAEMLSISGVPCKFPALAFRLLDYPTLIIYHVEPELAAQIRTKISADPYYKLGTYIPELQDKHGNFILKKGKSCLFKTSAQNLCDHLCATPLYVMLIDTYPEVPKLLGSFGIPLDSCIHNIAKDIEKLGIATPSTHGEKGDYKIYNLMGALVGRVTMGFRLLSLGQGLLAHLPENAITKPKVAGQPREDKTSKDESIGKTVTENLQLIAKGVQVALPSARPTMEDQMVQTLQEKSVETENQERSRTKRPKSKMKQKQQASELDDIIVTNVDCPPPLFYNSQAAEPDVEHYSYGLTLSDNLEDVSRDKHVSSKQKDQNSPESMSDEDTIRPEDKLDDSDAEDWVDFKASKIYNSEKDYYPPRTAKSFHSTIIRGGGSSIVPKAPAQGLLPGQLAGLPILNALLQEILALQETKSQPTQGTKSSHAACKDKGQSVVSQISLPDKSSEKKEAPSETSSPRPFTPRMSPTPARHTHRECASHEPPVPKDKSWLRSQPSLGIKKSKLTYGLTNTQRLRLAKANPELLKEMEEKEAVRLRNRKPKGKGEKPSTAPEETPVVDDKMEGQVPDIPISERRPSETRSPRPPKPTPRLSRQLTRAPSLTGVPLHPALQRQPKTPPSRTQSIDSQRPTISHEHNASAENEDDASETASDSFHSTIATSQLGNIRTIPTDFTKNTEGSNQYLDDKNTTAATSAEDLGFQKMVDKFSEDERSEDEYPKPDESNDFADEDPYSTRSTTGLEPQLRRVLSTHSDDSGTMTPLSSGYEPSLRKVVDKYSDSDEAQSPDAQSPIMTGYEPTLRKVVDQHSESESSKSESSKSESLSFMSTKERFVGNNQQDTSTTELNKTKTLGQPITSENSPILANKTSEFGTTRTALDFSNEFETKDSPNSTAYISQSQVPSDTATSLDSTGEWRKRPPKPSPRRKIDAMSSVHTDSVSSYAPSEPENASPEVGIDEDEYSDDFDEQDSLRNQDPRDIRMPPNAKLGYTWS